MFFGLADVAGCAGDEDREVDRNRAFCLDGPAVLQIRLKVPLADRLLCGVDENRWAAENAKTFNHAVGPDDGFQNHRALHPRMLSQGGISCIDGLPEFRSADRRKAFMLGSVRNYAGSGERGGTVGICRNVRNDNVATGVKRAVLIAGDDFDIERRKDDPVRGDHRRF